MTESALSLQIPDDAFDFSSWNSGDVVERLPVTPLLSPINWKNEPEITPGYEIRDGLLSAKNCTFGQFEDLSHLFKEPVFCDWVSIYQHHAPGLPKVNDGAFVRYDGDGVHQSTTLRKLRIAGSHESAVFVRCDGQTVWFEGNMSKLGRRDNVFGYTFHQCLLRINVMVQSLGLPPFTAGQPFQTLGDDGKPKTVWTGARVTRLDMTQNFAAGDKEAASHFMRWLATQQTTRVKTGVYGEGETVDFGRGSRDVYSKMYVKGVELRRHAKKQAGERIGQRVYDPYTEQLAAWCDAVGLCRFETTYKSTFFHKYEMSYLGGLDMAVLYADFAKRKEVLTRARLDIDELSSMEPKLLAVYRMWQAGDDLTAKYKKSRFYQVRKALLPYGVDIAVRSNVTQFQPRTRVITLGPVTPPDWYERNDFFHIARVA